MKQILMACLAYFCLHGAVQAQSGSSTSSASIPPKSETMKQILIDRFLIPQNAQKEFLERADINRNMIKKLPGFIEDHAYSRIDENGYVVFITIAVWENSDAIDNARKIVQEEYKKQGFNPAEMMHRLGITMERGTYYER